MDEDFHKTVAGDSQSRRDDNPWQILVVALLFFIPAVPLLLLKGGAAVVGKHGYGRYSGPAPVDVEIVSEGMVHFFGLVALAMSVGIVVFYFRVRRAILSELGAMGEAGGIGGNKDAE